MSEPTRIYHMAYLQNLPSILERGGLLSFNRMREEGMAYQSIAFESVQDRRARKLIPCGPKGCLHDYIPFYFTPRTPMLYTISRGNVSTCPGGQASVVFLVSTAERIREAGLGLVFSDGHGIMALSRFYEDLKDLDRIDWVVIEAKYWNDFPDGKRKRQAEFLVHQEVPWTALLGVAALDKVTADTVQKIISDCGLSAPVAVRKNWYF
jgi:hypothetical protein